MKIKCPVCGESLYTNPFGSNRTLHCDHCQSDLYRNAAADRPLRRVFVTDFLLMWLRSGMNETPEQVVEMYEYVARHSLISLPDEM